MIGSGLRGTRGDSTPRGAIAAIAAMAAGRPVVVADDTDRENEGDLILAADAATPEALAFIVNHTSGVVCVALPPERLDQLGIPLMVARSREAMGTAFGVTVDAAAGITTGISAADRARTIQLLAAPATVADDLVMPGHVFPLRAAAGGVLERRGHTEAAVDLARLAGRAPAGLLAELVRTDGEMMRGVELEEFAAAGGMAFTTVAEIAAHRRASGEDVYRSAEALLPTEYGGFRALVYGGPDGTQHLALTRGEVDGRADVLVRVHSECLTGDVLGSARCDCGEQLRASQRLIADAGQGVLIYLRGHEGRGIGIAEKIRAYALQDQGLDTVEANLELGHPVDDRDYGVAGRILADLGVASVALVTNNPAKIEALEQQGIRISRRQSLAVPPRAGNVSYLQTKQSRLGHALRLPVSWEA